MATEKIVDVLISNPEVYLISCVRNYPDWQLERELEGPLRYLAVRGQDKDPRLFVDNRLNLHFDRFGISNYDVTCFVSPREGRIWNLERLVEFQNKLIGYIFESCDGLTPLVSVNPDLRVAFMSKIREFLFGFIKYEELFGRETISIRRDIVTTTTNPNGAINQEDRKKEVEYKNSIVYTRRTRLNLFPNRDVAEKHYRNVDSYYAFYDICKIPEDEARGFLVIPKIEDKPKRHRFGRSKK